MQFQIPKFFKKIVFQEIKFLHFKVPRKPYHHFIFEHYILNQLICDMIFQKIVLIDFAEIIIGIILISNK